MLCIRSYNSIGQTISKTEGNLSTYYTYDYQQKLSRVHRQQSGGARTLVAEYQYDENGELILEHK